MIASWMTAAVLFGVLVAVAALAAEHGARALGLPGRWPLIVGLVVAVAWPAVAPFFTVPVSFATPVVIGASTSPARLVARGLAGFAGGSSRVDVVLIALWVAASAVAVLRLAAAVVAIGAVRRAARRTAIDGVSVLVTADAGPAVLGFARSDVVVPAWLADFDAPLRALVLRHEQEHQLARDPLVLWIAALVTALAPWSVGAWILAVRLRLAVELDCDARVLGSHAPPELYGRLLLLVAQRQSVALRAPALAESNHHLHRRIDAMMTIPQRAVTRATLTGGLALGALLVACSPKVTGDLMSPKPQTVETVTPPVVTSAVAPTARASEGVAPATKPGASTAPSATYSEFKVDAPARFAPGSAQPRYPQSLKDAKVAGEVVVMFVVDQNGAADPQTLKVLSASNDAFVQAIKEAMPRFKFFPAMVGGHPVKQLLRMPFVFAIAD